jgi:glycosyltransferase involved in cell wall biosynthesis
LLTARRRPEITMKLLVFSHACAAALNQQLYAEVARLTKWEIVLVVPSNWRDEYGRHCVAERWPTFQGELIPVPVRRPGSIILHTYRGSMKALIRRVNPDAVYVNHEPYAAATAQVYWANARVGRKPVGFYSCQNIAKRYPPPFRWTEAWVLRSSSFFFPISRTVEQVFRSKAYRNRSTVLPLAIDGDVYRPRDVADLRRELLGNEAADVLVGYVGRFVRAKGLTTLMTALGLIRDLRWRCVLVGAGELEVELRRCAAAAGVADRVVFSGFVPHVQVPRILSAMDVLVLPSETQDNWREQFGRVLLEAMACGTPVVGSDSGEIPMLIRDTGGGIVFPERDPTALADALRRMISEPALRRTLAEAGRVAVAGRYSIARAAAAFAETIAEAAAGPR